MTQPTRPEDYVLTQDPIDSSIWSVWREGLTAPYEVSQTAKGTWTCTCPHYVNRLRKMRAHCKHIDYVLMQTARGGFND